MVVEAIPDNRHTHLGRHVIQVHLQVLAVPGIWGAKSSRDKRRLAAIDQLLIAGIKQGPAKKREAINRIVELVPEWNRGDCWQRIRYLRKTGQLAGAEKPNADKPKRSGHDAVRIPRPWLTPDERKLVELTGYQPVKTIAQRLDRSERAVRSHLGALGMSAKVKDGWSLRALRKMLHVSPTRLRYLIGKGILRVRDPRIPVGSLKAFCDKNRSSLDPSALERVSAAITMGNETFSWDRVAQLLAVEVEQVQALISAAQLKVLDPFVTDRAFEDFCKNHGHEFNLSLMDPATARWLIDDYGVAPPTTPGKTVSRAQKHALVVRTCKCGRKIAGNVYFKHVKRCAVAAQPVRKEGQFVLVGDQPLEVSA
jgi:DNA-binding CsgD family transcriptional regulator